MKAGRRIKIDGDEFEWEYGVDTLPDYRRRGSATAVIRTVIAWIAN